MRVIVHVRVGIWAGRVGVANLSLFTSKGG